MGKKTDNSLLSAILDLKKIEAVNRPIHEGHMVYPMSVIQVVNI